MAIPRKAKNPFGPKVVPRKQGPQIAHPNTVAGIAGRVREVKERVADTDRRTGARLLLSARRFAEQIGITEQSFNLKTRKQNPTPFSTEELANICRVFCVRAEYLLLGDGPMLHEDIVDGRLSDPARFSTVLREHLEATTASMLDQELAWVQERLPSAETLMIAVEAGAADALAALIEAAIQKQQASSAVIRAAIAARLQAAPLPQGSDEMDSIVDAAARGEVIVLPRLDEKERQ